MDRIFAENNVCSSEYPYMSHNKTRFGECYRDKKDETIRAYPEILKSFDIGNKLRKYNERVHEFQNIGDLNGLEQLRKLLTTDELVNLIIYDIQTTGVPVVIKDDNIGSPSRVSFPSIIQISLYHPKTGRHFTTYLTPHKPITYESAINTGIYNSFELEFTLPYFSDKCNPNDIEDVTYITYINNTLLDHPEVKDSIVKIQEELNNSNMTQNDIAKIAIQDFLQMREDDPTKLLSIDENEYPMFYEIVDDIFQFISLGQNENTRTIMMSHNGSRWGEPILRAELERSCSTNLLDEKLIFIDSKIIFKSIFSKIPTLNPILAKRIYRTLGDGRSESFNAAEDSIALWESIKYVFDSGFARNDWNFIVSKLIEEIYSEMK